MAKENQKVDRKELRASIQKLIADVLKSKKVAMTPADIKEGVSLTKDLGIDSLDTLQLTAVVEKRYHLKFSDDEIRGMDDLDSIMKAVGKHASVSD